MDDLKHCSCICPSTYLYTRRSRACHRELEEASKHTYQGNRSMCVCVCEERRKWSTFDFGAQNDTLTNRSTVWVFINGKRSHIALEA